MGLESKRPPRPLFREGRAKDAWLFRDWVMRRAAQAGIRFPGRGVQKQGDNLVMWCPHQCGFGTTQLNQLNRLSGLKNAKDSCIQ